MSLRSWMPSVVMSSASFGKVSWGERRAMGRDMEEGHGTGAATQLVPPLVRGGTMLTAYGGGCTLSAPGGRARGSAASADGQERGMEPQKAAAKATMAFCHEPAVETRSGRRLLMAVSVVALAAFALACHSTNPVSHLRSQHVFSYGPAYNYEDEEGECVDMTSQYAPPAPAEPNGLIVGYRVNDALTGNPSQDWQDAAEGSLINFILVGGCDDFNDVTYPRRSAINIEYHATTSTVGSPCNNGPDASDGVSCVFHTSLLPGGAAYTWPGGHQDHKYAYVMLDVGNISESSYHHTINHETGHVLGLTDPLIPGYCRPACGEVSPYFDKCLVYNQLGQKVWAESIMHSTYYCGGETVEAGPSPSDLSWPTGGDLFVVWAISNQDVN